MTFSSLKTVFRLVGGVFFISIFYVVFVLAHGTFTDYQPAASQPIKTDQSSNIAIVEQEELSFITWNIGFGGLGKESEFFFDNDGSLFFSWGKMINAPQTAVEKNINGVLGFVQKEAADFYLFQEVDVSSKRSYYHNEFEQVANKLPTFEAHFATNYQVERVPIPIMEPWRVYGKALSGLATYGRFHASDASRIQLPGAFDWPTRIFQLDRCIAIQRYPTTNNGELVVMNIHHSAYDEGGTLKKQQMAFLKDLLMAEYAKGNYVIVGGDWNQCPPDFPFDTFMPGHTEGYSQLNIPQDYLPEEWTWAFDPQTPTNRKTHSPYKAGTTFVTLIDFFLVSPNVEVLEVKGINQGFDFSDHQPVKLRVRLR